MANHAVIRTDLMTGTNVNADLRSFVYMGASGTTATDIDNGNIVLLDGLMTVDGVVPDREIFKAKTPAADSPKNAIVIVASPEVMYDERLKSLKDFYNEAGKPARGYVLHSRDIFSVTAEALDGTATVGKGVAIQADTKLKVQNFSASTSIGKVIDIEVVGGLTYYVIEIM